MVEAALEMSAIKIIQATVITIPAQMLAEVPIIIYNRIKDDVSTGMDEKIEAIKGVGVIKI